MGYLLPWGQMSYWGAQVIVNLFGAIPVHRAGAVAVDPRRLRRRRRDAEPLLRLPRDRDSAGAAAAWWSRTWSRCTSRLEQPGRHRDQEKPGTGRPSGRWHPVPSVLHGARTSSALACSSSCSPSSCSSRRLSGACSWKGRISIRPTRCRLPSTSRRCGTSRRSTRCCARCRTSGWAPC